MEIYVFSVLKMCQILKCCRGRYCSLSVLQQTLLVSRAGKQNLSLQGSSAHLQLRLIFPCYLSPDVTAMVEKGVLSRARKQAIQNKAEMITMLGCKTISVV